MKTKILSKSWAGCYRKMGTSESTGDVRLDSPRVCGSAGERAQRLVAREQRCSVSAGHSRGARRAKDAGKGLQRGKAGGRGTRSCATAAAGLGWDQMGRDGTGPNGMGRDRMERDRMEWGGTGLDGMGWDRMGWDGMKWDGTGRDGMGWDGMGPDRTGLGGTGQNGMDRMGWDGMGRNGTGQDGTRWDGTEQDRVGWRGTEWDGMGTESDGMGQDRTGAEGRPAGCRAAAGEWRWSQAAPRCWSGGAAPMGARSLPERTRARAETSACGSGRAAGSLRQGWRYTGHARFSLAFSEDASGLCPGVESRRVCARQQILPFVSGQAAPSFGIFRDPHRATCPRGSFLGNFVNANILGLFSLEKSRLQGDLRAAASA